MSSDGFVDAQRPFAGEAELALDDEPVEMGAARRRMYVEVFGYVFHRGDAADFADRVEHVGLVGPYVWFAHGRQQTIGRVECQGIVLDIRLGHV